MYTKEQIGQWLSDNCTLTPASRCAKNTGLNDIHKIIFNHKNSITKAKAVRDLARFYSDKNNIIDLWEGSKPGIIPGSGLREEEKAFISAMVRLGGKESLLLSKSIADEYGIVYAREKANRWDSDNPFSGYGYHLAFLHVILKHHPSTKLPVFFPGGRIMPPFVLEVLEPIIPRLEFKGRDYAPGSDERVISRENRIVDFTSIVRFFTSEEAKVKSGTCDITKAKLAKLASQLGVDEICDVGGKFSTPKQATRINDFKVTLPLFLLSMNAGILEADSNNRICPGKNASLTFSLEPHMLARRLFDDYISSRSICETHYLTHIMIRCGDKYVNWPQCRKPIIDMLKNCPVDKWIDFEDFRKHMLLYSEDFFRDVLDDTVYLQGVNSVDYYGSYNPDWDECDVQIIRLVLSFMGALGMLDIAYREDVTRFELVRDDRCIGIGGFRITPLGAWILGLADDYDAKSPVVSSDEGGLLVQPDYTIVLSGMQTRIVHEPFLSGFLTKVSNDQNIAMYKIDFNSIIRAYNKLDRIEPMRIMSYLREASSRELPENVVRSFNDWQAKVGRVKIRTVTLLETDNELLLQELIHARGMDKYIASEIQYAAEIKSQQDCSGVKKIAENNGWLVIRDN
ncbi:MAG: helicase-associated domain-containing protein [Clostridia bacterium]|nr:helicase-associated domain-containing protein [Clostridia bacterium]